MHLLPEFSSSGHSTLELLGGAAIASMVVFNCFSLRLRRPDLEASHWTRAAGSKVAHRGCRTEEVPTGNTMSAFEAGGRAAGALELDVQLTADGEVVVFHDLKTARHLQGPQVSVMETTMADLRGRDFVAENDRGQRVPTLREVYALAKAQNLNMVVEIKGWARPWETTRAVLAVIEESGWAHRTMIISFNPVHIYAVRALGVLPTALIGTDGLLADIFELAEGSLLRSLAYPLEKIYEYAALHPDLLPSFLGATGVSTHHPLFTERLVRRVNGRGLSTNAWTVNCQKAAADLKAMGVNLITTDLPSLTV